MMRLLLGKMEEQLKNIDDNSIDSIVTDPPYHLSSIVKRFGPGQKAVKHQDGAAGAYARASSGFMGKEWDGGDIAFRTETWEECLRVLKPGGHIIAFSGSRTYHRMAVAIEDAGFEIRDQLMWMYGSGFPKSHNLGKNYDKKRGVEAEKLIDPDLEMKHIVAEWYEHPDGRHFRLLPDINGTIEVGAQNGRQSARKVYVEQFRKATGINPNSRPNKDNIESATHDYGITGTTDVSTVGDNPFEGWGTGLKPAHEPMVLARKPISEKTVVDNAIKWGVGGINIDASRVETDDNFDHVSLNNNPVQHGFVKLSQQAPGGNAEALGKLKEMGRFPANIMHDGIFNQADWGKYFYVPKVNKKDRNEGLDGTLPSFADCGTSQPTNVRDRLKDIVDGKVEAKGLANTHPTVKPVELMHYLIRLVTPKGGVVLDPFMGSGSTGKAAMRYGYGFVGIEMEQESFDVAKARIEYERQVAYTFG